MKGKHFPIDQRGGVRRRSRSCTASFGLQNYVEESFGDIKISCWGWMTAGAVVGGDDDELYPQNEEITIFIHIRSCRQCC